MQSNILNIKKAEVAELSRLHKVSLKNNAKKQCQQTMKQMGGTPTQ
jgi:hypothetical protein